jgi:hypothetical protein
MTKHEADVIGGLNMTDQISNEAYKQIMIAAQDENEVGYILDKIRAEIEALIDWHDCPIEYDNGNDVWYCEACNQAIKIIDKYKAESEEE